MISFFFIFDWQLSHPKKYLRDYEWQRTISKRWDFLKSIKSRKKNLLLWCKSHKAGDYYLTITESKKFTHDDGSISLQKTQNIPIQRRLLFFPKNSRRNDWVVFDEKGEEVISERHQKDFKREFTTENGEVSTENFTDINFDDI